MVNTQTLLPGITLRHIADRRFRQGALSLQLVRPMCREEAAMNALLPAVLLRGTRQYPDLRAITGRLDDLYGASVSALVRRVGDLQTTGLYCGFMEDRFAMEGDAILAPVIDLARQLLLEPAWEPEFIRSERKNLVATIEAQRNDKRAYAMEQLLRIMCREDSFGIPRLGEKEDVAAITEQALVAHRQKILAESPLEIFYVGSAGVEAVAELLKQAFRDLPRQVKPLPDQTPLRSAPGACRSQRMDVNQGKLCLGFVTPTTIRDPGFAAMQVLNTVFGGGMTSKLFMQLRERQSLCYAIGSGYHGSKGIVTVSAGIDFHQRERVKGQILEQLELCRRGQIRQQELEAAKESLRAGLQATQDSPGALEGYYATAALSGLTMDPQAYIRAVEAVTPEQAAREAQLLGLHSEFFLEGERP